MKVPYFLLELGDKSFFQPQNTIIGFEINRFVQSVTYPEARQGSIFLNGNHRVKSHSILLVTTSAMKKFEKDIDSYNARLYV